jgi:hypothetical protein
MVKKRRDAAVTKSELVEILQAMETRLETRAQITQSAVNRLVSANLDTNEYMKALEGRVAAKLDGMRAETTGRLESFSSRMETLWRDTIVYPKMLDEHGALLRGHEQRIAALESRRSP